MRWIILIAVVLWFVFGEPGKNLADWIWEDTAAPWEEVDAFYYPDKSNLSIVHSSKGLESVDECRRWVSNAANENNDPNLERGDYECGVGFLEYFGELRVYRKTVR